MFGSARDQFVRFKIRKTVQTIAVLLLVAVLFVIIGRNVIGPLYFRYSIHASNTEKERQLLYKLNHQALALELREFAKQHRWNSAQRTSRFDYYHASDVEVPASL